MSLTVTVDFCFQFAAKVPSGEALYVPTRRCMKSDNIGRSVRLYETDHFVPCPVCGHRYDARDLYQVTHHAAPAHDPLPEAETMHIVDAGGMLAAALKQTP